MKTVRMTIDSASLSLGRIDPERVDATSEDDIAKQVAADQFEVMQEAAKLARQVCKRLGLSQK